MLSLREIADTWSSLYASSAALRSVVSFAHVGALVGGGGCAVAADLGILRALRRGRDSVRGELDRLHATHRIVIGGLVIVFVSGLLLALADVDAYLESTAFWIKMALVVGLALNGAALVLTSARAHDGDARAADRLGLLSRASLALWLLTTLMGAVLPNAL
jgi:hypothetical protein